MENEPKKEFAPGDMTIDELKEERRRLLAEWDTGSEKDGADDSEDAARLIDKKTMEDLQGATERLAAIKEELEKRGEQ